MIRDAVLSPCGRYRYTLTRLWGLGPLVVWVMLNPSTADAENDDPTIAKVIGFSQRWGFGGAVVANLFALRATDPRELVGAPDPIGIGNVDMLLALAGRASAVVAAWGASVPKAYRSHEAAITLQLAANGAVTLGQCAGGAPKHPLFLPYTTARQPWDLLAA